MLFVMREERRRVVGVDHTHDVTLTLSENPLEQRVARRAQPSTIKPFPLLLDTHHKTDSKSMIDEPRATILHNRSYNPSAS